MERKIVCLGKNGNIGRAFSNLYKDIISLNKEDCDINNIHDLNEVFSKYKPQYIINATGIVGNHISDSSYVNLVNIGGVINLSYLCKKHNCKLIHFSSFYSGDYSAYTQSKQTADDMIIKSGCNYMIIELPWLFGDYCANGFITNSINGNATIFINEEGYLIYDKDLINWIMKNLDNFGIMRIANEGKITREYVLEYIGIDGYITFISRENKPTIKDTKNILFLRDWKESIKEYLDGLRSMQPTI